MQKFFRRGLNACLIAIFLLSAALVGATVKLYTATAEDYANEVESQDISKQRARDKAIKKATKQAGVYLKSYSRSVNSELTDDDILAITSNAWQLVGEPKYTRTLKQISGETTIIVWTASVEVNVDDSEIQSWIKRDDKDKSTIISQTREAFKSSEENDRKIEDLREKYNRATSQAERDSIIKQMNDADRDFLANQKLEEGNKLYYEKNYTGAIKFYNESIELDPNFAEAYNNRGAAYDYLGQYERALQDYDKAIKLNPKDTSSYMNRGFAYFRLEKYDKSCINFNKAIKLNPLYEEAYYFSGLSYYLSAKKQIEHHAFDRLSIGYAKTMIVPSAISDFTKVLVLNPNNYYAYCNRGDAYQLLNKHEQAIQDYDKAIELNPNFAEAYNNRGIACMEELKYEQAIQNFNKAIELEPNVALRYQLRGMIYKKLGDKEKAQADFAKAKQLGYNG